MELKSKKIYLQLDVLEAMHIFSILQTIADGLEDRPRNFANYLFKQSLKSYEVELTDELTDELEDYAADSYDIRETMYNLENE